MAIRFPDLSEMVDEEKWPVGREKRGRLRALRTLTETAAAAIISEAISRQ
jgi:hypothetical protein